MGTAVTQTQKTGIATYLGSDKVKENILPVVGEKDYTSFVTSIVSAVQTNKDLAQCTNTSIVNAALLGQTLKLSPSPQLGQYYMVAYDNKGVKEACFQLGFKGYLQLAMRSGQYRKINVVEVKDGELLACNPFTEEYEFAPITDPKKREKAEVIGYYAYFELTNGYRKDIFWSLGQMQAHAKQYSKGYKSDLTKGTSYTFWSKNFNEMAKKTMLRQLISKWGIMSLEFQNAFNNDQAVIREDGTPDYVDNGDPTIEDVEADVIDGSFKETMPEVNMDDPNLPDFMKG